jgi:hypothetical protein
MQTNSAAKSQPHSLNDVKLTHACPGPGYVRQVLVGLAVVAV